MLSETQYGEADDAAADTFWYENDLLLAAELGKTLLERNKDLEAQVKQAEQIQTEQTKEIDLLTKQLEVLRNVNESRMRIYEEVDRNLQAVEKNNSRLAQEAKADKDKIKTLTSTFADLEVLCDELQVKVDDMKAAEKKRQRSEQRTWSVPSLTDVPDLHMFKGSYDYLGFPAVFDPLNKKKHILAESHRMRELKESARNMRLELSYEKRKRCDAETELSEAVQENTDLRDKVAVFEKDQAKLESELQEAVKNSHQPTLTICKSCGTQLKSLVSQSSRTSDPDMIEHDISELPRGQLVRLKNGGSAYGSRESLHKLGLETDDTTPSMEHCSAILASYHTGSGMDNSDSSEPDNCDVANLDDVKSPDGSLSILGELENQYRKLVRKYEKLVDVKNKRSSTTDISTQNNLDGKQAAGTSSTATTPAGGVVMRPKSLVLTKEVQTAYRRSGCYDITSPVADPIDGHFDKGPPEYKKLFKEIFETLKRSSYIEDDTITSPKPKEGASTG